MKQFFFLVLINIFLCHAMESGDKEEETSIPFRCSKCHGSFSFKENEAQTEGTGAYSGALLRKGKLSPGDWSPALHDKKMHDFWIEHEKSRKELRETQKALEEVVQDNITLVEHLRELTTEKRDQGVEVHLQSEMHQGTSTSEIEFVAEGTERAGLAVNREAVVSEALPRTFSLPAFGKYGEKRAVNDFLSKKRKELLAERDRLLTENEFLRGKHAESSIFTTKNLLAMAGCFAVGYLLRNLFSPSHEQEHVD
ncbi:TPA: hypothetical protein DIC20_02945 [Candidatus Dependentiae bacterium]|nr:MAG: hypothetical protein US03_C0009G0044 [candidate division TM6 bacterium GW2011_GWF2_36_131]KKQ19535.1 MAG: hypothetical protein US32_C0008G0036 [candidate division TM6 bacterium GW2011_GWA2_36_9]HBR70248.1 hypothetical protein [Candidatus Dependentiae bacterium]HCU00632.1 hypothetical protein [Candidatus Dependentiae bacterium]